MTAPVGCLDGEQAIRDALAAGPTPGPWHVGGRDACTIYDRYSQRLANSFEGVMVAQRSDAECKANGLLLAACHPETMRSLLAELDRLRSASRQEVDAPSDLAARFVEQHDALRRALEVIAVGDSADPVRDAGDELVALGIWSGGALEQHRAMLAAAPHQSQEAQGD